jgi:hypothetical protein
VKVTLQLPETRVHGFGVLKPPVTVDVMFRLKVTLPVGVVEPPVTVAVHNEPWLMNTGVAQLTAIPAAGVWTVIVLEVVGPLPAWTESLAV